MNLLDIPQDVVDSIMTLLSTKDVVSFRLTCREAHLLVMENKKLWDCIVKNEISSRGLRLPTYLQAQEHVDAKCMESWIRSALSLQKCYKNSSYIVSKVVESLWITWVRLVRGRWCIVASSDLSQSRLSIYDSKDDLSCKAEYFFEGPVMDGQLEDTSDGLNMAVTIGSKILHIDILSLKFDGTNLTLHKLATIPGASFTRMIRGTLVGYAVHDNDDSYAYVFDWSLGKSWCLKTEVQFTIGGAVWEPMVDERGPCFGMTLWQNRIVTVYKNIIVVFNAPQAGPEGDTLKVFASAPLRFFSTVCDVRFSESYASNNGSFGPSSDIQDKSGSLYVIAREMDCKITVIKMHLAESEEFTPILGIDILAKILFDVHTSSDTQVKRKPFCMALGSTGSMLAWCGLDNSSDERMALEPATLQLTRLDKAYIRPSNESASAEGTGEDTNDADSDDGNVTILDSNVVPDRGLPPLHDYPCMDFDDARGVMLVGTKSGEICLVRFYEDPNTILFAEGLNDEIPRKSTANEGEDVVDALPKKPIPLDLPAYYEWKLKAMEGKEDELDNDYAGVMGAFQKKEDIPVPVIMEAFKRMNRSSDLFKHPLVTDDIPGWSIRWRGIHPHYLEEFVRPVLRWGYRDPLASVVLLKQSNPLSLPAPLLCDAVPVIYKVENRNVIYRVGNRVYLADFYKTFILKVTVPYDQMTQDTLPNIVQGSNIMARIMTKHYDNGPYIQKKKSKWHKDLTSLASERGLLTNGEDVGKLDSAILEDLYEGLLKKRGKNPLGDYIDIEYAKVREYKKEIRSQDQGGDSDSD